MQRALCAVQLAAVAVLFSFSGCFTVPLRVRGEDAVRRVRFEVAYSTESPPDRATLDDLVARVRKVVAPGVEVSWVIGDRIERRERWTEEEQEACAREHRHLSTDDTFFIHWSSGRYDEPQRPSLRMAHSWGGNATAFYAEVVRPLPDVRPSTVLLHEWGHNLGLVGVALSEEKPERARSEGGHCPDPGCVMYRLPVAQESFCPDCLEALAHAPARGTWSRLLAR